MNDKYSLFEDLVRKTARFVARDFPEVEEDDLFQDVMLYVLGNPNLRDPDKDGIAKGLYKRAVALAWEYRKQALYISAQYSYRTSDVRRLLDTLFDYEDWDTARIPDDAKSIRNDDWLALHSDISAAFDGLPDQYKEAVRSRYQRKIFPTTDSDKRRLTRAIERLTDNLNFYSRERDYQGPGSRRVINNATAQYTIQEQS